MKRLYVHYILAALGGACLAITISQLDPCHRILVFIISNLMGLNIALTKDTDDIKEEMK